MIIWARNVGVTLTVESGQSSYIIGNFYIKRAMQKGLLVSYFWHFEFGAKLIVTTSRGLPSKTTSTGDLKTLFQ